VRLTPRETRLALAVAQGKANKIIAADTGLSLSNVKFALSRVYAKLSVSRYQVGSPRVALALLVRDQPEMFQGEAA
jgi:DNA-binding NarL/FixJ family response regulator